MRQFISTPSNSNEARIQPPTSAADGSSKKFPVCICCPYGYHIDLDFVRYCETLGNDVPSDGQRLRRDRRRQRHSREIMLGLGSQLAQLEKSLDMTGLPNVGEICDELESPIILTEKYFDYQNNHQLNGKITTEDKNELDDQLTSAYASNALADAVFDFERTLERASKRQKSRKINMPLSPPLTPHLSSDPSPPLNPRIVCPITTLPQSSEKTQQQQEKIKLVDEVNISEINTETLHYIRERMEANLFKIHDLEEQIKIIPVLQLELQMLNEEKSKLEQKLSTMTPITIPHQQNKTFTSPQRISPVQLPDMRTSYYDINLTKSAPQVISSKVFNNAPSKAMQDIGILYKKLSTDSANKMDQPIRSRSICIGTQLTIQGIDEKLFTQNDFNRQIETILAKNLKEKISVGTQMIFRSPQVIPKRDIAIQTISIEPIKTISFGTMTQTTTCDKSFLTKPESYSIGCSDNSILDVICEKCKIGKKSIGCGTDVIQSQLTIDNPVSLKALENLTTFKQQTSLLTTQSTQTNIPMKTSSTQSIIATSSKSCQSPIAMTKSISTDTINLIYYQHKSINTERIDTNLSKISTGTNTNKIYKKECAINTEKVQKLDVACGGDMSCDSSGIQEGKLADDFSIIGGVSSRNQIQQEQKPHSSKIPRFSVMNKDRSWVGDQQQLLQRQNTYTIQLSPSTEGPAECPLDKLNLDTVKTQTFSVSATSAEAAGDNPAVPKDKDIIFNEVKYDDLPQKEESLLKGNDSINLEFEHDVDDNLEYDIEKVIEEPELDSHSDPHCSSYLSIIQDHGHEEVTSSITTAVTADQHRDKAKPSKTMLSGLKVINDSLQKSISGHYNLKNAETVVKKEWFRISSTEMANPLDVEDYLNFFEENYNKLLKYMVNLSDLNGNTAIHYAVSHGNFDIVSILLDSKVCNVNHINNAGYTCVMLLSLVKLIDPAHLSVVQRLFQLSDVNIKAKKHGQTALMLSVSHGNLEMVNMLLEAGADINIQDEDGSTALMCAAEHGKIDIVKLLLAHPDCDSGIQDVDGSTALKISLEAGYRDIGILLYAHEHMMKNKSPLGTPKNKSMALPHKFFSHNQKDFQK